MKIIGNSLIENFKMAMSTVRSNKLRSFLTVFGVIIGVITVMLISSIISGINVGVEKQVESFGTTSIFLNKNDSGIHVGRPTREQRMRKPLTEEDAEALTKLPTIVTAVPILDVSSDRWGAKILITGSNGKTSSAVQLKGTTADIEKTTIETLITGRWFTENENETKADVAVIGQAVIDSYFPYVNPLGEKIEIGGREFRVIGTIQKKEQLFGGGGGNNDQSNVIYMPMGAALRLKPYSDDLGILAVAKEGKLDEAKDQVQDLMRIRRQVPFGEKNNFSIETAASVIETFQSVTAAVFFGDDRNFFGRTVDRRNRRDEYYARFRYRTNARNRHSQSHRRETERYSDAVFN